MATEVIFIMENIGVSIGKCEFDMDSTLFWQLRVAVELVDSKNGTRIFEPVISKPSSPLNIGSFVPIWNEILACNHSYQDITNVKNNHYLFLFELFDHAPEESSMFNKKKTPEFVKRRVAWAFLKPIAANNSLNLNQPLRLRLFKPRKNCLNCHHQTCEIFHLYSHKRKKFPGYLECKIQPIHPPILDLSPQSQILPDSGQDCTQSVQLSPKIVVSAWSRLPTQSCKIPNSKYMDMRMGARGVSCLAFSVSGIYLSCAGFSKISLMNIRMKKELARFTGHTGLIYELCFSPDDRFLLSVSADCSAILWDVNGLNRTPMFILPHASFVYCGKWLRGPEGLMTGGKDGLIRFWRQSEFGFDLMDEIPGHEGYVSCLEVLGNASMISGDSIGMIFMWVFDAAGHWLLHRRFDLQAIAGKVVDCVHCHPGQRRLVVTARGFGSIMLDIHAGAVVCVYPNPIVLRSLSCLSPCGSLLFSFGPDNVIYCWRFDDARLLATYHGIIPADGELSGCLSYHPFEHMMALGVLGAAFPCSVYGYSATIHSGDEVGLRLKSPDPVSAVDRAPVQLKRTKDDGDRTVHDKLAAIVQNIDRVLAVKRDVSQRIAHRH